MPASHLDSGYNTYNGLAACHLFRREYAKSSEWALRATSAAYGNYLTHLYLAAARVGLGDIDKAMAAMDIARRLSPRWIQHLLEGHAPVREGLYRQHLTTFFRIAAGLEEPEAAERFR